MIVVAAPLSRTQQPRRSNNCMIDSNLFSTTMRRLAAGVCVTPALRNMGADTLVRLYDF